tara:strand:- start:195 stop:392 length:198 start_codon:yes stop_codon:yes gene_type:complete
MAKYGTRNHGGKRKNIDFYLKPKKSGERPTLLAGSEEEQRAIWAKDPAARKKLLAQAAKAKAKRK